MPMKEPIILEDIPRYDSPNKQIYSPKMYSMHSSVDSKRDPSDSTDSMEVIKLNRITGANSCKFGRKGSHSFKHHNLQLKELV